MFNFYKNLFSKKFFDISIIFLSGFILGFLICHYTMFHKLEDRFYKALNKRIMEDLKLETKKFEILPFHKNKFLNSFEIKNDKSKDLNLIRIYDSKLESFTLNYIRDFTKSINFEEEIKNRKEIIFLKGGYLKMFDEPFLICKFKAYTDFISLSEEFNIQLLSVISTYATIGISIYFAFE